MEPGPTTSSLHSCHSIFLCSVNHSSSTAHTHIESRVQPLSPPALPCSARSTRALPIRRFDLVSPVTLPSANGSIPDIAHRDQFICFCWPIFDLQEPRQVGEFLNSQWYGSVLLSALLRTRKPTHARAFTRIERARCGHQIISYRPSINHIRHRQPTSRQGRTTQVHKTHTQPTADITTGRTALPRFRPPAAITAIPNFGSSVLGRAGMICWPGRVGPSPTHDD
ncbi:hypothetical protein B0J18DRAFT_162292 [Chaetomium sp. MPI-SDFR-AT-0129]|nr:hypothetical protein B0J18DRAFT_162292 [Chaetomium sp. MPI-SDFR-AT-0129]